MSFRSVLDRVLNETPGAVGVTLMGFDGIAIDSREKPSTGGVSPSAAAIEIGQVASQLKGVAEGLGAGEVKEVTVHTGALITVLRPITAEYFLALSLLPDGNTGKGRYLMRILGPTLADELAM